MERIFECLRPLIRRVARHPGKIVAGAILLTLAGLWLTSRLTIDTDFARLIPSNYPSVRALNELQEAYGGESEAAVIIESPSFEANRQFAEALIPRLLALQGRRYAEPYFTHADFRRDIAFLERNALYFATTAELDSVVSYLQDRIEEARLEANPFYFALDDDEAEDATTNMLEEAYETLVGSEYPISSDSTTMVVRFYPSGSQTDIGFIRDAYRDMQTVIDSMGPEGYHPSMIVDPAGRLLRQLVEVDTIMNDAMDSFGGGVMVLLLFVATYFLYKNVTARSGAGTKLRVLLGEVARMPVTALVLGLPLIASVAWSFGIAKIVYGSLNMVTSTLGLILFGLGIDFGIHFYARYTEERGAGNSVETAIERTFMTTGQAVTVVGLTTAAAFFILMIADFKGFSQYGFIAGMGILFALVAMLILLPALLALLERFRLLNLSPRYAVPLASVSAEAASRGEDPRFPRPHLIALGLMVATALSFAYLPGVAFEYDFGKLDPEYVEYSALQRRIDRVYSDKKNRNAAYILTQTPGEIPPVVSALREHMRADTLSPTIRAVESLHDRFPMTDSAQASKLQHIARVRNLLDDAFLSKDSSEALSRLRTASGTREPLALGDVPAFLREKFATKNGDIGNLVIIYPSVALSHGRNSMNFADDVGRVKTASGTVYVAASTSIVASDMLRLMIDEAPWMVAYTIGLIILFKTLFLRRLRWVLLALIPLCASFAWMFGLMVLFGWKLNFYNLVVLPTVLGIGDDSGIHIVHRYLEEGRGSMVRVLRSTGEHISASAATTMIGFGGLLFSSYPGMRSIGEMAVLGIGMTLIAALMLLPAMVQWMEDRSNAGHNPSPDNPVSSNSPSSGAPPAGPSKC